jgi:hypothetical protein
MIQQFHKFGALKSQNSQLSQDLLLANAEMLLQVAAMQSGGGRNGQPVPASASLDMLSSMGFGVIQ